MIDVIRGAAVKENSTNELIDALNNIFDAPDDNEGIAFIGYPILNTVVGGMILDAVLVTKAHGIIVFDLVEDNANEVRAIIRDEIFANTHSRLIQHENLRSGRQLDVDLSVLTYAPLVTEPLDKSDEYLNSGDALANKLATSNASKNSSHYHALVSVLQAVTKIASQRKRHVVKPDSRGSKLKAIESAIANLDSRQNRAVIETTEGPQRIRGLAGSGKTIILALKAAYLHTRYPEWNIAVTFNTRSLKQQFVDLVTKFTIEQKREDPDWDRVKIVQSWGSNSSSGIYYDFCLSNGIQPMDLQTARAKAPKNLSPLGYASLSAFNEVNKRGVGVVQKYDAILIDEAQDLSPAFIKLCYSFLKSPKRLIYAYDELQNLSMLVMESPEKLFGRPLNNDDDSAQQDIILERCYRNSRPVLITAHGLGFGTTNSEGLVQMFDEPSLWREIGYELESGSFEAGSDVVLFRPNSTSPLSLENHSAADDLIQFKTFESNDEQSVWVANEIEKNLNEDELTTRDIIIITLNPLTAEEDTAKVRSELIKKGINSHLSGVTTSPDEFFKEDSVAVTGIFRAKGNEAGMVYIINSEYAQARPELIRKRNILFSAITRSKAWVRVVGCGPNMEKLCDEYNKIKDSDFKLCFKYPSKEEMDKLRVINRDLTESEKRRQKKTLDNAKNLAQELHSGNLRPEDIDPQTRQQLELLLFSKKDESTSK